MTSTISVQGQEALQTKLAALEKAAPAVQRSAVVAACVVLSNACKDASPGSIRNEVGFSINQRGNKVVGRAGLMRFPRKGDRQNGPHGVYLEYGTKFIAARHFVANALRANRSRAIDAARRAAQRKLDSISK